jgi:integrase
MQITPLLDLFLRWCAQHRAPATCRFYNSRLRLFRAEYGPRELATLTPIEIFEYLTKAGEGQSDSTRRHNAVALERLQAFALEHQVIDRPLFGKLEKPRMGSRERIPTPPETAKLLRKAPDAFVRIYSALRLAGARPGEFCRATIADWDRITGVIVLAQHKTARKTGKPRRIPIGRKLATILERAIAKRTAGPIFLSPAGKPWTPANLSQMYARLRKKARLPGDLVLYLARHECGTKLCRSKGIEFARRMLGHASIATTQRYTHLDESELAQAQDEM